MVSKPDTLTDSDSGPLTIFSFIFSEAKQLAAVAILLSSPAMFLSRHQRRHPCRVPEDGQTPLLPVGW